MYTSNRLDVEFDKNRKITDLNSIYRITILPPQDLAQSFFEYSEGFYKAAHLIASYLLETDKPDISHLDSYFFSLAFLYRHSVELILKAIAFRNIQEKEKRISFAKDTFHDLARMLDEVLKLENWSQSDEELNWLKKYLIDISQKDKESDSFRYPFHIVRTPADLFSDATYSIKRVFEEQTHVNLLLFANKFEAAYEILSSWYMKDGSVNDEWKSLKPVFIETGGYYYGQSVVGYGYKRADFYPYVSAYVETASYLRSKMQKMYDAGGVTDASELFMPMCYLYRNAVELAIKSAWFEEARVDYQSRCKILYKKKHSISGLWNKLSEWIKKYYDEDSFNDLLDEISIACESIQGFDASASKFRYPCSKDMELHFPKPKTMDIMSVAFYMESLIDRIDCVEMELSMRNEYINEMEADLRREMEAEYRSYMY